MALGADTGMERHTRNRNIALDGDGNAVNAREGLACCPAFSTGPRSGQCAVLVNRRIGVQRPTETLDARQIGLGGFNRGHGPLIIKGDKASNASFDDGVCKGHVGTINAERLSDSPQIQSRGDKAPRSPISTGLALGHHPAMNRLERTV